MTKCCPIVSMHVSTIKMQSNGVTYFIQCHKYHHEICFEYRALRVVTVPIPVSSDIHKEISFSSKPLLKKMRPLKTNQQVLRWICVLPWDESTSKWKKIAISMFALSVFIVNVSAVAASIVRLKSSIATDLEESLYSLFPIAASSSATYAMVVAFLSYRKIDGIFRKLSEIQNSPSKK